MKPSRSAGAAIPLLALLLALASTAASACGYCVEDRIAAVYDHALLQRAQASKHELAYFAWDGPMTRNAASRQQLQALLEGTPGVDKGSARVSMEPAALALAFDPQRSSAEAIGAALRKKLKALRLSLVLLQVPETPAP